VLLNRVHIPARRLIQRQPVPFDAAQEFIARSTNSMLDILSLAIGLGFFAASIAYVYACDRL
jgi:hypothetical protein